VIANDAPGANFNINQQGSSVVAADGLARNAIRPSGGGARWQVRVNVGVGGHIGGEYSWANLVVWAWRDLRQARSRQ